MPNLPETPMELSSLLARRLGAAAIAISFAAGGVSYRIETRRAEQAALESAVAGARHFESPAMQMAIEKASGEHLALNRLLDRTRFVGIRIFSPDRALIYETWEDIPIALINAAQTRQHEWPGRGQSHRNWITVSGERLIQVVLPLFGKDGTLAGYLEGVSRLDTQTVQAQTEQVRNGALTAAVSVLATALLLYPLLLAMLRQAVGLSSRLLNSNLSLMRSLGNAIAKRDSDTDSHNYRVTCYAVALAEAMGLPKKDISALITGAFLHDVGKIGIPDSILLKAGKLTNEEFEVMKTHVLLGIEIVEDNPWLKGAALTIRYHHERFDGTGYPEGLRGDSIPLNARLFAVVDVFDALTSERPYKKPMALNEAMVIIECESGCHFDPTIVAVFKRLAPMLYTQTCQADRIELHRRMHETLARYFLANQMPS
ncbi:MAG: HD-GYP domain-containing protein [Comamonadaceae bacterium]|uniref:HD-GYP domain-containing protein n=1 Tax=Candidatus Skiveiella danica TaxID=3386177 RepID=UPI00390BB559|nr:HD-GYP domain-containing protein [Comamonadaceae bacterium]